MFIQTETTPNPDTLKFLPGRPVLANGTAEFKSYEEGMASPLARALFNMNGIAGVFYGSDFISVTKNPDADWHMLKTAIMAAVMDHYMSGMPLMDRTAETETAAAGDEDEVTAQIRELLDTRVRPAVAQDGGDITFVRFEDGVVYLRMQGACSGCPSSTITLKNGVETMLRHYLPEVRAVEAI